MLFLPHVMLVYQELPLAQFCLAAEAIAGKQMVKRDIVLLSNGVEGFAFLHFVIIHL